MADWKQITARIRRARTSKDPAGQLSNLYEKTHDAMVAFELGKLFENSRQNDEEEKSASPRTPWRAKPEEGVGAERNGRPSGTSFSGGRCGKARISPAG